MWGWLGAGRWVPAGAAYPPEGTVGAAVRTWREAVGRGAAGLHRPAEAEAQAPPCASRSEGRCCRTKTKRVEDLGVSLLDLQLVMEIGRWGMLGRLGGDMGQTLPPPPSKRKEQPGQVLGRGWQPWHQKIGLVAGPKYRLSPQGSGQPPPPSPRSWGNSRNRTER